MNSFNDEQRTIYNHIADLGRKLQSAEFNLVQLRFGQQAFIDALRVSLGKEKIIESE